MIDEANLHEALLRASRVYRDACHAAFVMRDRDRMDEAVAFVRALRPVAEMLIEKRLSSENAPRLIEMLDKIEAALVAHNEEES